MVAFNRLAMEKDIVMKASKATDPAFAIFRVRAQSAPAPALLHFAPASPAGIVFSVLDTPMLQALVAGAVGVGATRPLSIPQ